MNRPPSPYALALGILTSFTACARSATDGARAVPVVTRADAAKESSPLPLTRTQPTLDHSDDAAIADAARDYLNLLVEIEPEHGTALGIHTHDADLNDRTVSAIERALTRQEEMLKRVNARFANPKASREARTDLLLLTHALAVNVRTMREVRPYERMPAFYTAPMNAIYLMTAREFAPASERANNVIARLDQIPSVIRAAKSNLKNPPRVWTEIGIENAASAKTFFDEQRPMLEAALPHEKARIAKSIETAKSAYAEYHSFLKNEVLPRSKGQFAAGQALFDFLLRENYFLDESAHSILAVGKKIFEETERELTTVSKRIDPGSKTWSDVTRRLKENHPTADGLLDSYRKEVARARAFIAQKNAFDFPPGDDLRVVDTPPFQRSTISIAYDQPPPFDTATSRGLFFVTPVNRALPAKKQEEMLRENDHGDQVDTVVHEAYPGHHLQLSFARLQPSVIRKVTDASIFSEGWALYAEEVMNELGYYTDEERLFQLEWTLVRAARVILDVGLHTQGMTFDDAVSMLTDHVHLEHELAVNEVKRYTTEPTQPLSYLVGREAIFRIRDDYRKRKGAEYSLKAFHKEVLSHGTIAPGLLAREMN